MKKTVIWLDNYLEEFLMVVSLILMTVIMGNPGVFQICTRLSSVLVGGDYPIPVCMVGLFECQLLYEKVYFY